MARSEGLNSHIVYPEMLQTSVCQFPHAHLPSNASLSGWVGCLSSDSIRYPLQSSFQELSQSTPGELYGYAV
jgi:hypothetical protein